MKRRSRRRRIYRKVKIYLLKTFTPKTFKAPRISNRKEYKLQPELIASQACFLKASLILNLSKHNLTPARLSLDQLSPCLFYNLFYFILFWCNFEPFLLFWSTFGVEVRSNLFRVKACRLAFFVSAELSPQLHPQPNSNLGAEVVLLSHFPDDDHPE